MTCLWPASSPAENSGRKTADRRGASLRACAAAGFLLATIPADRALAADWLDDMGLRGSMSSKSYNRWDGLNFGAQIGVSNMNTNFGDGTSSLVAFILRNSTLENEAAPSNWTALPSNTTNGRQFGGFIGYNLQYDQLVLGIDGAYNRAATLQSSASDSISRRVTTSDNIQHDVTIAAQSSLKLIDYATLRARAGYAMGQFLPYAAIGAAVGRFNYSNSATVSDLQTPPSPGVPFQFGPQTLSDSKDNAIVGGGLLALGLDVAVLPNVFLRGEWEFVAFAPVHGLRTNTNTGRVGIGVRF